MYPYKSLIYALAIFTQITSCTYFNNSHIPRLSLLTQDSLITFNTANCPADKSILFVYFNTECRYCHEETQLIMHNMDSFRNTQFYFITEESMEKIKAFSKYFNLSIYSNILLCKDNNHSFYNYFNPTCTPYLIFYNKKRQIKGISQGSLSITKLIFILNS